MPRRLNVLLLLLLGGLLPVAARAEKEPTAISFERDIRPIFKTNCFQCHGEAGVKKAGLDLRLRKLALKGGKHGPAIVPDKADKSLLVQKLREGEMPPEGKPRLTNAQIELVAKWVQQGAAVLRAEPDEVTDEPVISEEERAYWAFQPVVRREPPTVKHAGRVRTPVDAFVLAKLEEKGLTFAADADRATLIRRATFDLTGLPPTPEEIKAFVDDSSTDAYEALIDRLLESSRYGERWGRHWLDVAGYADSDGFNEVDTERKWAWKYRDYVIRSITADKPFDQFIIEQLAGDELVKPPYAGLTPEDVEKLTATGFLRMAPDGSAVAPAAEKKAAANQVIADQLKIVSTSLLGLTVGCAQCHDHRYDPIPQADYYSLRAIFEPAYNAAEWKLPAARLIPLTSNEEKARAKEIEAKAAKIDADRVKWENELLDAEIQKQLTRVPENVREALQDAVKTPVAKRKPGHLKLLKEHPNVNLVFGNLASANNALKVEQDKRIAEAAALRATKPEEVFVAALTETPGKVPDTYLFNRGDCDQPKQIVKPAELRVLSCDTSAVIAPKDPSRPTSGRRLAYAKWLTSGKHPLVGRVLVNRVWMHHFGKGIVASAGDFGQLGDRPTHPELLDWLASEFAGHQEWRLKRLHKLMMLSTVYRQSSAHDPAEDEVDPDNKLLGRWSLHRLDAESFRDALLSTSGKLNEKAFGPPVPVMHDDLGQIIIGKENLSAGRPGPVIPMNGEDFRRSVWVQVRRSRPLGVLSAFDAPMMEPNCEARKSSTAAPQALLLMNNEFVVSRAVDLAERVVKEAGTDRDTQLRVTWRLIVNTEIPDQDLDDLRDVLKRQTDHFRGNPTTKPVKGKPAPASAEVQALATVAQALWSSNRFLYVE